jgi:aerobic-type carbon monoxide dehydrogenase small subunit (CoxS/CutS family)
MDRERIIRPNPTIDQQLKTEVCRCTGFVLRVHYDRRRRKKNTEETTSL